MGAPPSTVIPPIVGLLVRVLTFFCLFISTIVLSTNKIKINVDIPVEDADGDVTYYVYSVTEKFHIFYAYRYLLSCIVIGLAYTILQTALSVIHVSTGKRLVESLEKLDFYLDLLLSNLLISGAAASFGLTVDLERNYDGGFNLGKQFYDKIYASTSLCLIAFVFAAIATIISHMNASRKSA